MQPGADSRGFTKAGRRSDKRQSAGHADTQPLGNAWGRDKGRLRDITQLKALGVTTNWAAPYVLPLCVIKTLI
jgi:hypothetical protein